MIEFSLVPYIFVLLAIFTIAVVGYFIFRNRRINILKRSLNFVLYEVSLPRAKKEEGFVFKDIVARVEQFYYGMLDVKPYFVVEIASPSAESETNFYVAVPRDYASFFEKQIHSVFPGAEVREEGGDYNIFKYRSFNAGAVVSLKEKSILPVKTYENLNADPLEVIINTFSSIEREEEGAALQIVVDTTENDFKKNAEKTLKLIEKGESPGAAMKGGDSLLRSLGKVLTGGTISEEKTDEDLPRRFEDESVRGETMRLVGEKMARPVLRANIRVVVSSHDKERSRKILGEMKSFFSQFINPRGNSFSARNLKGSALRKMFYNFSFRFFDSRNAIYLNTAELTSLFHFPVSEISAPKVKFLKFKKAEPPINLSKEGVLLGKNTFRDSETEVRMGADDRRRHFYIIGQTGTGKSVMMKNMIAQDIRAGHGVCFIDPHGDSVEEILGQIPVERQEDVIYFNPADTQNPFGLNMLEYDASRPEQKTFIVNELLEIFQKLFAGSPEGLGPVFQQYFRNATLLVMEDPSSGNTLLEISRVLSDAEFRHMKISKSKNSVVNNFWVEAAEKAGGEASLQNMVPYITSKFDTFLANEIMRPILCQQKSSFNLREAMDSQKILLINLSKGRLGETNAYLLGMILVGRIFMAAMSRIDTPEEKRNDFYLYLDEFQNITTKTIAMILSEARKYRLSLVMGHQFIGQLEEEIKKAVFGNVGSLVSFRAGEEDAEFLEKYFEPVFTREHLMNMPNYKACIKLLIDGQTSRAFDLETCPPEKTDSAVAEKMKEFSAAKYGRPFTEIELEINNRYQKSI